MFCCLLKADEVLVSALGEEFIKWWASEKKDLELKLLEKCDVSKSLPEDLEMEKSIYFDIM